MSGRTFPAPMICPGCGAVIPPDGYAEGEDDGDGDVLMPYATWTCRCGHVTPDWEDAFVFPEEADAQLP